MNKNHELMVKEDTRLAISKRIEPMCSFDQECNELLQFVSLVFGHFGWYGANSNEERVCILQYLSINMLRIFQFIKLVYGHRCLFIHEEHCDLFGQCVLELDEQEQEMEGFISEAEETLRRVIADEPELLDFARKRLMLNFKEAASWMDDVWKDPDLQARVKKKCREMKLRRPVRAADTQTDCFRQHTYAVLDCLKLLAVPSCVHFSDKDFVSIFRNSYDMFCQSAYWKEEREVMVARIEDEYEELGITTTKQRIEHLSKRMGAMKGDIRQFLAQFGINYTNTKDNGCVGKLGRKLYAALNTNGNEGVRKMSNEDLCLYLEKEARLGVIAEKVEQLKHYGEDSTPGKEFFAEKVHRSTLYNALYKTIHEEQLTSTTDKKRYVLGAQSHWIAILKVMQSHDMVRGTMVEFSELMKQWYPIAPVPCDYRSMISVRAFDVKHKPYSDWDRRNVANYPYLRVAETFEKRLHEYELI